jgi:hypothetical protein
MGQVPLRINLEVQRFIVAWKFIDTFRGVAQSGSAPALGARFWRWWASVSAGNAGFLRQLRP